MAIFNDLAIELQEAIWNLVLPTARGVHWIEVEGIPQDPESIRDSIRMTKKCNFDRMPETHSDVTCARTTVLGIDRCAGSIQEGSSLFFRKLLTTVPAVFGHSDSHKSREMEDELANEIANTNRCRQLSTYYQITTLLSLCRLSRSIAQCYIQNNRRCSWPIRRSMGPLYRPRPIDVWEAQYSDDKNPAVLRSCESWQLLQPQIHTLDLVVFRLHNSKGQATSLLKHAPWQYFVEHTSDEGTFACFDRVGIEWHPSWGTVGGRSELRAGNVEAFVRDMQVIHFPSTLYWLVDGVPRPDWKHDYPAVVQRLFADRIAAAKFEVAEHLNMHWDLGPGDDGALLADHHLGQGFEANGRRYYIVFVVFSQFLSDERDQLDEAGLGCSGPFPGSAAMWPEAIREPVRLACDVCGDGSKNLGTYKSFSYILSWEPIS